MRAMTLLGLCAVALSACATMPSERSLSPSQKIRNTARELAETYQNRQTVSCEQLDKNMATSYTMYRALNDKKVVKKSNEKAKEQSTLMFETFLELKNEHARRCPGKPLQYLTVKKLYPEIMKEAKRRHKEKTAQW